MKKRISSRAIIIDNDNLLTMFRRKIKDGNITEYYAIPGGGIEENETLEETAIREIKEEFGIDIEVLGYLGKKELPKAIEYYFHCKILKGIPKLGGEELERNTKDNYYEVRLVNLKDIDKVNIFAKDLINLAIKKQYKNTD